MRYFGSSLQRETDMRQFEVYGRFSRKGRWILLNTYDRFPFDYQIEAIKKLNGVKFTKVEFLKTSLSLPLICGA